MSETNMSETILTQSERERMQSVDLRTVDPNALQDIQQVTIHTKLPQKERIQDYIRQIGNPYCYRNGKYVVKTSFADTDVTLEERMISYLRSKEWAADQEA